MQFQKDDHRLQVKQMVVQESKGTHSAILGPGKYKRCIVIIV